MIEELHQKAEELRETEKFKEALVVYDKVIEGYLSKENWAGVADALQGKVLTYKHLYARNNKKEYLEMAIGCAKSSFEIVKIYKIEKMKASVNFRLGDVFRLKNDFKKAVLYFSKAYRLVKDNKERGDYLYHLGEALYKSGEKTLGKRKINEGIKLIKKDKKKIDPYIYHVWLSGANMRMAQIYFLEKNKLQFEKYIKRARKIIEKDERLIIRKKQFEEIKSGKYYW